MDVIKRIRDLMEEKGYSEYRLAKEAFLHQSTIANIFHRNSIPSVATLESICKALGVSLSDFFTEEGTRELSSEEIGLLNDWNKLSREQRDIMIKLIRELIQK